MLPSFSFHCSYHGTNYLYREPFFSWPIDVNGVFIGFLPLVQNDPTNKRRFTLVHFGLTTKIIYLRAFLPLVQVKKFAYRDWSDSRSSVSCTASCSSSACPGSTQIARNGKTSSFSEMIPSSALALFNELSDILLAVAKFFNS